MWATQLPKVMSFLAILVSILFLTFLGATYGPERYYWLLPTLTHYPNCETESKEVARIMQTRTPEDMLLFQETNEDGVEVAFIRRFPECTAMLKRSPSSWLLGAMTIWLKVLFNRARPYQLNPEIQPEPSLSAKTPAFPSGHALEAYFAARLVSKHCPHKEKEAIALAEECAKARVIAGLHYPSDAAYSKKLAAAIPNWLIV